eukprot:Rhum_TRINITY_DN15176_c2_g2::Rhum_TRINITY_DN15176_c2_g2_i1::g.142326::m.142326
MVCVCVCVTVCSFIGLSHRASSLHAGLRRALLVRAVERAVVAGALVAVVRVDAGGRRPVQHQGTRAQHARATRNGAARRAAGARRAEQLVPLRALQQRARLHRGAAHGSVGADTALDARCVRHRHQRAVGHRGAVVQRARRRGVVGRAARRAAGTRERLRLLTLAALQRRARRGLLAAHEAAVARARVARAVGGHRLPVLDRDAVDGAGLLRDRAARGAARALRQVVLLARRALRELALLVHARDVAVRARALQARVAEVARPAVRDHRSVLPLARLRLRLAHALDGAARGPPLGTLARAALRAAVLPAVAPPVRTQRAALTRLQDGDHDLAQLLGPAVAVVGARRRHRRARVRGAVEGALLADARVAVVVALVHAPPATLHDGVVGQLARRGRLRLADAFLGLARRPPGVADALVPDRAARRARVAAHPRLDAVAVARLDAVLLTHAVLVPRAVPVVAALGGAHLGGARQRAEVAAAVVAVVAEQTLARPAVGDRRAVGAPAAGLLLRLAAADGGLARGVVRVALARVAVVAAALPAVAPVPGVDARAVARLRRLLVQNAALAPVAVPVLDARSAHPGLGGGGGSQGKSQTDTHHRVVRV